MDGYCVLAAKEEQIICMEAEACSLDGAGWPGSPKNPPVSAFPVLGL